MAHIMLTIPVSCVPILRAALVNQQTGLVNLDTRLPGWYALQAMIQQIDSWERAV